MYPWHIFWPEWKMSAYDENLINQSFNTTSLLACVHATFLAYVYFIVKEKIMFGKDKKNLYSPRHPFLR